MRGLRAVPTVKMIDVLRLMYNYAFEFCTFLFRDYAMTISCFVDGLACGRADAVPAPAAACSRPQRRPQSRPPRDAPPRAHPLPTLTDRSRFPVPHGRSNTLYSEGAQPNLSAHRAVRAVDVLRPRSSLLFAAPPLPHVAPPPLSLHMPSCIHTSLCAPATGPAHHSPSHGASAQHGRALGGSRGGSRGGSQGSSHA